MRKTFLKRYVVSGCCALTLVALVLAGCEKGGGGGNDDEGTGSVGETNQPSTGDSGPSTNGTGDGMTDDSNSTSANDGADTNTEDETNDSAGNSDSDNSESQSSDSQGSDEGMNVEGGPKIESFSADKTSMTEGESITLSVSVSDSDGAADIKSGSLKTEDGTGSYGSFSGSNGEYSLTLSWADLNSGLSIDFEGSKDGGSAKRIVKAEFEDGAGNKGSAELQLTLSCEMFGACEGSCGAGMCEGTCVDLAKDDDNCGGCGIQCVVVDFPGLWNPVGECVLGKCEPTWSSCIEEPGKTTCDSHCESLGEACVEDGCFNATSVNWGAADGDEGWQECLDKDEPGGGGPHLCDQVIDPGDRNFRTARCCCTQTPG